MSGIQVRFSYLVRIEKLITTMLWLHHNYCYHRMHHVSNANANTALWAIGNFWLGQFLGGLRQIVDGRDPTLTEYT